MRELIYTTEQSLPIQFTDVQLVDPFNFWKHVHQFVELEDGVLVKDRVHYELLFGIIGQFAHSLFIKKRIEKIFSYRKKSLEQLFNL